LQNTARNLKKTEAANSDLQKQLDEFETAIEQSNSVNNDLKKQLDSKEEILQSNNEKNKGLQTTIDGLTELVDILNQTVKDLCAHPKDVSTCKVESVTVRSLRYLRQSGTSNLGQRATFQKTVVPLSSGSRVRYYLMTLICCHRVLLGFSTVCASRLNRLKRCEAVL
jgi:myosin heavy subunit